MTLQLQYISDIHLEFRKNYILEPSAPNLALCGDIGYPEREDYWNFILDCSKKFKNVFVIFGNHEYYNPMSTGLVPVAVTKLSMVKKRKYTKNFPDNVYFLHNKSLFIDPVSNTVYRKKRTNCIKIIGSTLWTNVDFQTSQYMNDYKTIYISSTKCVSYRKIRQIHKHSVEYILEELDKDPLVKTVLLTHHGSHPICFGDIRHPDLHMAYVTNIPELYRRTNLIACISGHTHSSISKKINFGNHDIEFLSNQLGYLFESSTQTSFTPIKIFNYKLI